jgi:hypothetical protein
MWTQIALLKLLVGGRRAGEGPEPALGFFELSHSSREQQQNNRSPALTSPGYISSYVDVTFSSSLRHGYRSGRRSVFRLRYVTVAGVKRIAARV